MTETEETKSGQDMNNVRYIQASITATSLTAMNTSNHIKRPMNAFMVWSQMARKDLSLKHPNLHNAELSKTLGRMWHQMSEQQKVPFSMEASRLKNEHKLKYPNYRYKPKRRAKLVASTNVTNIENDPSCEFLAKNILRRRLIKNSNDLKVQQSQTDFNNTLKTMTANNQFNQYLTNLLNTRQNFFPQQLAQMNHFPGNQSNFLNLYTPNNYTVQHPLPNCATTIPQPYKNNNDHEFNQSGLNLQPSFSHLLSVNAPIGLQLLGQQLPNVNDPPIGVLSYPSCAQRKPRYI